MENDKFREKKKKGAFNKKQTKDVPIKQPTLLVREHPTSETEPQQSLGKAPSLTLKTREHDSRSISPNVHHQREDDGGTKAATPVYQIASKAASAVAAASAAAETIANVLQPPPLMLAPVKLLDETLSACEGPLEYLMDQNDFLVVGVVGSQCSGKSYILSQLAGSPGMFRSESKEIRAVGGHCTVGVDMYVTQARVIFLDTQPLFSAAVMDCTPASAAAGDKKFSSEVGGVAENSAELSDLHLIAFLLSVCHVVLCVDDWMLNLDTIRYVRDAEMLKPSTPTTSTNDLIVEYFPTLVLVKNNASASDFTASSLAQLEAMAKECFYDTQLKVDNGIGLADGRVIPYLRSASHAPFNIFLLPFNLAQDKEGSTFHGHIGFGNLVAALRQQILCAPRQSISSMPISEKHWYHYSAKVMENIKKGNFFMEYSRLLT